MIEWNKITDEEMRDGIISQLANKRDEMLRQAERCERDATTVKFYKKRMEDKSCARCSRRQAAHFQQAIDLLTEAPMPAKEET
jgi:hypothetical protein